MTSVFTELHLPLLENLDAQVALRYEDFSDVGNTTVPKIALGWQVFEPLLLRASWSEAFRAPNLVTINEEIVARNNTRTDYACEYAEDFGGVPDENTLSCRYALQRIAQGSDFLEPEESTNWSAGMVIEPLEGLMITFDYWSIEKEDTIGLFGEENHTLLDLLYRLDAGTSSCASFEGNPAIGREPSDPDLDAYYLAAGICPAGDVQFIDDRYANLDNRTVEGYDVGIYWDLETPIGDFSTRFVGSFLEKFEQEPGGLALELLEAQANGTLPSEYPVAGFADLIRIDGNQEERVNLSVAYNRGDFGSSITAYYVGDFIQDSLTIPNPDNPEEDLLYEVDSMTTYNFRADYTFNVADDYELRTRIGVNNFTDERAPLADRYFGYFSDSHRDLGRYYYLDVRLTF